MVDHPIRAFVLGGISLFACWLASCSGEVTNQTEDAQDGVDGSDIADEYNVDNATGDFDQNIPTDQDQPGPIPCLENSCPNNEPCEDGFCCNRVCAGECEACNHQGKEGRCSFLPSHSVCRPALGPCDIAEECSGESGQCPADVFAQSDVVCRPAIGDCDLAETCAGASPDCPEDLLQPNTVLCRPAAGCCDAPEYCTGTSGQCPTDSPLMGEPVCDQAAEIYFCQPDVQAIDVDDRIIPEIHPASEYFVVRMANLGPDASAADVARVNWNVGDRTGFFPAQGAELADYQRGPNTNGETTAVQMRGRELGIWFDSDSTRPVVGDLLPITPGYWWWNAGQAHFPWAVAGRELSYRFSFKVPTAIRDNAAQVYACAYFLFTDVVSGKSTWYGASVFDLRPSAGNYIIYDDWAGGTHIPIILTTLDGNEVWMHQASGSASFHQAVWNDYQQFDFRITAQEFLRALAALKQQYPALIGMSDRPANYRLDHFNLNPEVYAPAGSRGRLGVAAKDIWIATYNLPTADHVYIRGANATGSAKQMQVFFKTDAANFYDEAKSVSIDFPEGGGWLELVFDMSQNALWQGNVTGLRVDPFNGDGSFGIDYVRVGDGQGNMVQTWEFNGASTVTNPFFGWTLNQISQTWTDGSLWGGVGTTDPFFYTDVDLWTGR